MEPKPVKRRRKARPEVLCTAKNTRGEPCGRPPIRGGTVCYSHGGAAKHVRAAAQARLANASYDLTGILVSIAKDPEVSAKDRISAINSALDRAGIRGGVEVELTGEVTWQHRLDEMLVDAPSDADRRGTPGILIDLDIEDAEVVGPLELERARQDDEKAARIAKRKAQQDRLDGMRAANRPTAPRPRYDS